MQYVNIAQWMKRYLKSSGAKGYVIGLSGGIDSSVVAALAVKAVGKEHVRSFVLPCSSNPVDTEDGLLVGESLGLKTEVLDLTAAEKALTTITGTSTRMGLANIRARLRMTTLYAQAGELGYLVAGTSNRPELEVGYFTKYGDGGVDIEPLGQYYKAEVFQLGKELGLPEKILQRVPSAGLWEGQTDEIELGMTYNEIEIFSRILESGNENDDRLKLSPSFPEKFERFRQLHEASRHKRVLPPVFRR